MLPAVTPKNRFGLPSAGTPRPVPIRLGDDADPEALRLEHTTDDGHAEAGVIDVGIAGDDDDVAAVPAERLHFGAAGRQERRPAPPWSQCPFLSRAGAAQGSWPSRQIRMVCSYPAGGQTDLLARAFGEFIGKQVGQNVVDREQGGRLRFHRRR
jgi:hypothetical protein